MPRPKSKDELLDQSEKNYQKLMQYVGSFSPEEQELEFPLGTLNRNIRDVLAHLHHWHVMTKEWYTIGMKGEKPDMPARGYTWMTLPELNREIQKMYLNTTLEEAKQKLKETHEDMHQIIRSHSNEELFEKKRYQWTGATSMGSYFTSSACSHYDWAFKLIRKVKKNS